jgi:putative holliday junction resolvase
MATPYSVIERSGDLSADRARVAEIVAEVGAGMVLVGLPLSLDGREGPGARAAREEAEALRQALGVPVETHDERLSSVSANRALTEAGVTGGRRRKARRAGAVDQAAATVFLQAWLDLHRERERGAR